MGLLQIPFFTTSRCGEASWFRGFTTGFSFLRRLICNSPTIPLILWKKQDLVTTLSNLAHLKLSPAGMVFNSCSGENYQINDSANLIIHFMQTGKSTREICDILAKTYNLSCKQALADFLEFKLQLAIFGLV
jgi:hypothetical protein